MKKFTADDVDAHSDHEPDATYYDSREADAHAEELRSERDRTVAVLKGDLDRTQQAMERMRKSFEISSTDVERRLRGLLRELCSVPAVQQALGTDHTTRCDCIYCRARAEY
jgi:hypothetical protein